MEFKKIILILGLVTIYILSSSLGHAAQILSTTAQNVLARVYVPNTLDGTVSVIDPKNYRVIDDFITGKDPQHIVPSYDLKKLWVLNDKGNSVTPINPKTAKPGISITVNNPYNMYFTQDGRFAIIINDKEKRFDFRDPHTMALFQSVPVNCKGLNHMDFTADGHYGIASCEISGELVKLDVNTRKVVGYLPVGINKSTKKSMPQDVRAASDGKTFFVADMLQDGVYVIDPITFRQINFISTGKGAHGILNSRDHRFLYVSDRGCNLMEGCPTKGPGDIAVIDPIKQKVVARWPIPDGGSPDMGQISTDGKELWLSGKYDKEVYVFNTETGKLLHRIPVGNEPHGLTYWPQPGRYSLGHTGIMK